MHVCCRRGILILALTALVAPAPTLQAQDRFEILSRDAIAQLPDVSIDTIRDRRTSTCFAMFTGNQRSAGGPAVGTTGRITPRVQELSTTGRAGREEPTDAARDRAPDPQQWAT